MKLRRESAAAATWIDAFPGKAKLSSGSYFSPGIQRTWKIIVPPVFCGRAFYRPVHRNRTLLPCMHSKRALRIGLCVGRRRDQHAEAGLHERSVSIANRSSAAASRIDTHPARANALARNSLLVWKYFGQLEYHRFHRFDSVFQSDNSANILRLHSSPSLIYARPINFDGGQAVGLR